MLPGQVAAPEGPVDLRVAWALDHGLRRDLGRFVAAVRATATADRDAWRGLADRWGLFAAVLRVQSGGQDRGLWPAVRRRCRPEDLGVLAAMEAEHAALESAVCLVGQHLARLATGADDGTRAALVVRLAACREAVLRHLAHEESDAMPLVQETLTQAEWERIDREHYLSQVSWPFLARMVPWVAHGLPRDAQEDLFSSTGAGFRLLWLLTRGGFARREARVLGAA